MFGVHKPLINPYDIRMRYKKIVLPNGLRLILAPQPDSLTATVLFLVRAGSEYETKSVNGISHFLEHMMFKGTTRRPSARVISAELDSLGSEYNAFTGQEYTGYFAKASARKLPALLDIVSDLCLDPVLPEAEIEKERGVIIEEINMYEDTPQRRVRDLWQSLLYGDQPAGWDITGPKEVIRRLSRADFIKYRAARYVAPGTVVVVSGKFNAAQVTDFIRRTLGQMSKARLAPKVPTREAQSAPAVLNKFKKSDQSHLVIGFRAFDIFDPRRYTLQVLGEILGGGMSSRLFDRLRTELGVAYYVYASPDLSLDHGSLSVAAGIDSRRLSEVVKVILEEFRELVRTPVGEDELKKAKDHLTGTLMVNLETSDEIANFYGGQEVLVRKIVSPEELIRRVQKVSARNVRELARQVFRRQNLNMAVIGPHRSAAELRKLLAAYR